MFADVTGTGIINRRFLQGLLQLTDHTDLTDPEKADFLRLLVMVANKLGAVWYHKNNYKKAEDLRISEAKADPIPSDATTARIDVAPELFYEFDAFLVQIKSCLDHLVKVPRCFVGRTWNLMTFGSKGQDVVKAVRNNLPARFTRRAAGFLMLLEGHVPWIEEAILARDRINHLKQGGVLPEQFSVFGVVRAESDPEIHVPKWSGGQSVRDLMEVLWANLYTFCEEFVGISIMQRLGSGNAMLHLPLPLSTVKAPWTVTTKEEMDRSVAEPGWTRYIAPTPPERPPGRNDPCHCGSGNKYKRCCLARDQAAGRREKMRG